MPATEPLTWSPEEDYPYTAAASPLCARVHEFPEIWKLPRCPGLPNSQIANELIISDATVKTHVARVLMKLNLADRVHAVIFAYESGLVLPGEA